MTLKIVKKPWGKEVWFAFNSKYVGKLLYIKKGHRLSRQYHRFKDETVYTDRGRYLLEVNGRKKIMEPGTAIRFAPRTVHRMEARYDDVRLIEVSTPHVKDVVRLDDDYNRVQKSRNGRRK